jgi:phosphoglycolate phosphatase
MTLATTLGPIDALLFDLDGTLVDAFTDIAASANAARVAVGRTPLPEPTVRSFIGDGLPALIRGCLDVEPGRTDEDFEAAMAAYQLHHLEHLLDHTAPYEGVRSLLHEAAAHAKLAVVSNKREQMSRRLLAALGMAALFTEIAGGDTFADRKPSPVPVLRVLAALGVEPARAMMIGDGPQDVRAGVAAGVLVVGVTWGLSDAARLSSLGADAVVDDVNALRTLLRLRYP